MTDAEAMALALAEAAGAVAHGDVPVGAVVIRGDEVLAARHNEREVSGDPSAHAEMLAIRDACATLVRAELADCTLAVTLEPCAMCAAALALAHVGRVVFGAADPKAGACGTLFSLYPSPTDPSGELVAGVGGPAASALLVSFFADLRATRRRRPG
jgi:tRNA(adenine34) deaminase